MGLSFLGILCFFITGAFFLNRNVSEPMTWAQDSGEILYAVAMTVFVSYLIAASLRRIGNQEIRRMLRYAGIWALISLLLAVAYSYRFELAGVGNRVMGNLVPGRSIREEPGKTVFQISADGHFYIRALVNGAAVRFLADTGATHIVLSPKAAKRIGLDTGSLHFDRIYRTANGMGRGASVRLDSLEIGSLRLENVGASVNETDLEDSLLGMSFFNRLKGYTVKNGMMTIYW